MPAPSDILQFARGQLFEGTNLPKTSFEGQTILITGANTGLGFESAKQLVALEASVVVLACRSISKGEVARDRILASCPGTKSTLLVWQVDMGSYDSVKELAARMWSDLPRLDALIANAGISTNVFHVAENLESTLTINVVATFLLAILALPQLEQTAIENRRSSHLAITGSNVHAFADHVQLRCAENVNIFRELSHKDGADMAGRYFLSKLMVMLLAQELAVRFPAKEASAKATFKPVIINCPSPGWCKTDLFREDDGGFWGRNMLKLIGRTPEQGARTLPSAIAAGSESHGQYLSECRVKRTSAFVRSDTSERVRQKLWKDLSEILKGLVPEELLSKYDQK